MAADAVWATRAVPRHGCGCRWARASAVPPCGRSLRRASLRGACAVVRRSGLTLNESKALSSRAVGRDGENSVLEASQYSGVYYWWGFS